MEVGTWAGEDGPRRSIACPCLSKGEGEEPHDTERETKGTQWGPRTRERQEEARKSVHADRGTEGRTGRTNRHNIFFGFFFSLRVRLKGDGHMLGSTRCELVLTREYARKRAVRARAHAMENMLGSARCELVRKRAVRARAHRKRAVRALALTRFRGTGGAYGTRSRSP